MPLVIGRAALIGVRSAVLSRYLARPGKGLVAGWLAAQERLGLGRGEVPGADRGQPDTGIGDNIAVVILGMQGRRVRIGIEAPLEIPVMRQEVCGIRPSVEAAPGSSTLELHHAAVNP